MAYLRQKLLERLRTIGVVNHHFNHRGGWRAPGVGKCRFKFLPVLRTMNRGGWRAPGVGKCRFKFLPVLRTMIFQLEHRGGVLKMDVLRHQIETLALAFRRWQHRKNLPAVVVHHN